MPYLSSWCLTQSNCEKDYRLCFAIKMIILCDSFFRCTEIFWGFEIKFQSILGENKKSRKKPVLRVLFASRRHDTLSVNEESKCATLEVGNKYSNSSPKCLYFDSNVRYAVAMVTWCRLQPSPQLLGGFVSVCVCVHAHVCVCASPSAHIEAPLSCCVLLSAARIESQLIRESCGALNRQPSLFPLNWGPGVRTGLYTWLVFAVARLPSCWVWARPPRCAARV